MGFKLPGKSIQSGTSGHRSALKMYATKKRAALKATNDSIPNNNDSIPNNNDSIPTTTTPPTAETPKKAETETTTPPAAETETTETETTTTPKKTTPKKAYGGDGRTWQQANKDSGGDLNKVTRDQKAYEKQKKAENPDWNKREDNQWKKRQNKINAGVGSKKVYEVDSKVEVIKDKADVKDTKIIEKNENKPTMNVIKNDDGEKVFGAALDADKELNKNSRKTTRKIGRQKVKDARKEFGRGSDEVKAAKVSKRLENKKATTMVKTGKKDRKFVDKDEKLQIRIDKRKDKGRNTSNLENKKAKNLKKQKEFGESLG